MYSQNNEEQIILEYFKDFKGHLLDIGANDGVTLSNSRKLIELGWSADLVEPAPIPFKQLQELYKENNKVKLHNCAISDFTGITSFYVSGEHLGKGDSGLLSTLSIKDKQKWEGTTDYFDLTVQTYNWQDFNKSKKYNFISIDAEGFDLSILKQINLDEFNVQMVCVEHNNIDTQFYMKYLESFYFQPILINNENIIAVIS
jgi:FkbM family methyltransferase